MSMTLDEAIGTALEYLDLAHGHYEDIEDDARADLREAMKALTEHLQRNEGTMDVNQLTQNWHLYAKQQIAEGGSLDDDADAAEIYDEGVALIKAEPQLWMERGWRKLWEYIVEEVI